MEYDVVVVGGGVNGTGIARDLALRGLRVALVEKKDLASGASGANSGMIHGGLRYLLYDIETTKHSCLDSGYIQKIAPHLLFRIPFVMPIKHKLTLPFYETYFEVYDKFATLKNGKPHTILTKEEIRQIIPNIAPDVEFAITTDEWGIDPHRLCVANALSAKEAGAEIRLNTEMVDYLKDERGNIVGVKVKSRSGFEELRARIVMQATGPWIMKTSEKAGVNVKIRPGKGVHLTFDRRLLNYSLILTMIDGRASFIMPHENTTILGTTDDDYYGDLDDLRVSEDEVEYLVQGAERYLPSIRDARIIRGWVGVRPTLYAWGKNEDLLSRDHRVFDHEELDGVKGIVSIAGGKLASYRLMSEEASDLICRKLGVDRKCETHILPLPGGEREVSVNELADKYKLSHYAVSRIVYRHGARAVEVLELGKENPELFNTVCRCEPVLACELVYCIRNEWGTSLTALRNRTRLGTGPCQGARCALSACSILAKELGLSSEEARYELVNFLERRFRGKRAVLEGKTLEQEELNQAIYFCAGQIDKFLVSME